MRFNALIIISISCGLFFISNDSMAQYRDPFSEKSKRSTIKKGKKKGKKHLQRQQNKANNKKRNTI